MKKSQNNPVINSMIPIAQPNLSQNSQFNGVFSSGPNIPTMMTIREVARTGLLSEYTLRSLVKQGKVPHVKAGVKVLINFELFCEQLNNPQQLCS